MTVALACDHRGYRLKEAVKGYLEARGIGTADMGTDSEKPADYPDYGFKAAESVASGACEKGVVICGTGVGMSVVANRVPGVVCMVAGTSCRPSGRRRWRRCSARIRLAPGTV